MNIVIAHPKRSFIEATTQMLQGQQSGYKVTGVNSLTDLVEKISLDSFQVALVDSDLAGTNYSAFLSILATLKDESFTIVTLRENETELAHNVSQVGVHKTITKTTGYLPMLSNAIRQAGNGFHEQDKLTKAQGNVTPGLSQIRVSEEGYLVCDRRGRFLSVNPVLEQITRYSMQELLQLSITDLIPENQDGNFLRKIFDAALKEVENSITVQLIDKLGELHLCKLQLRVLRDDAQNGHIIGFRGRVHLIQHETNAVDKQRFDQTKMVAELIDLVQSTYNEPLNIFMRRIVEITCQIFGFKRSTIALLDRRKQAFIKQALVGYSEDEGQSIEQRALEVPREVIDRIFFDRYRIKVIYFNQDQREFPHEDNPGVPERRTQRRRPLNEWHKRDLVLLNLKDHSDNTFGYISLDGPHAGMLPTRTTFYNLELFSRLISMCVENYYRFISLAKKNRRLKQILANSNIFKLHLSLTELLNETVWSARHTLEFNLVALMLLSKKTQMLETKAVACDDQIKQVQIRELTFDIHEFSELLKEEYQAEKSFLINKDEPVLHHLKQIYFGSESNLRFGDGWPNWALLLVPVKGRDGKIIGFIIADDPRDCRIPSLETIQTLEILANQIAVAIDNRIMFVQAREQGVPSTMPDTFENSYFDESLEEEDEERDEFSKGGFKKLVERFLR